MLCRVTGHSHDSSFTLCNMWLYIATFGLMTYFIYSFFQSSAPFIEQIRSYVHIFLFLCIQKLVYSPCTCYNTNNASDSKPTMYLYLRAVPVINSMLCIQSQVCFHLSNHCIING